MATFHANVCNYSVTKTIPESTPLLPRLLVLVLLPLPVYRVGDPIYIIRYPGEDIWDVLGTIPAERRDSG